MIYFWFDDEGWWCGDDLANRGPFPTYDLAVACWAELAAR